MPRLLDVTERVGARLQASVWPESRAALRNPITLDPPPPRQFAGFGAGSWIVPPGRVEGAGVIDIGTGVVIMEHAYIRALPIATAPNQPVLLHIGDGTRLARFVSLSATVGIHIGDRVSSSDYVAVADCWGPPGGGDRAVPAPEGAPVTIQDGAYLGCGCFIGPGVTVGEGAFIGEGAVVLEDVPAHCVVYGNPARVTQRWTSHGWLGDMFGHPS